MRLKMHRIFLSTLKYMKLRKYEIIMLSLINSLWIFIPLSYHKIYDEYSCQLLIFFVKIISVSLIWNLQPPLLPLSGVTLFFSSFFYFYFHSHSFHFHFNKITVENASGTTRLSIPRKFTAFNKLWKITAWRELSLFDFLAR